METISRDLIDTLLAVVALVISLVALIRTRVSEDRRRKLEVATHLQQYYGRIRVWAEEVIQKLSDAVFLCELDPERMDCGEFFKRRHQMRADLSSLLDQGRLYLPNTDQEKVGISKPSAYRGLRQAALNCVNDSYELVESLDYAKHDPNKQVRQELVDAKRKFTSEMQDLLDIRKTSSEIIRLAREI